MSVPVTVTGTLGATIDASASHRNADQRAGFFRRIDAGQMNTRELVVRFMNLNGIPVQNTNNPTVDIRCGLKTSPRAEPTLKQS